MKKLAALLIPVFAASLVFAQTLPDGDGKKLVQDVCSACHGLDIVVSQRLDKDGWEDLVAKMVGYGATAKDDEVKTMVTYLTKNFPKDKK